MSNTNSGDIPRIGVSSCLLGQEVRYDGGHKLNRYVARTLGEYLELVPWCPEVAIGLGIPRPTIRQVRSGNGIRVVGVDDSSMDVTDRLIDYAREVGASAAVHSLSGYIFKKDSPSCGMERVRVYTDKGVERTGTGAYASEIMAMHPNLPVEEEGRLNDAVLRENFITRVFTLHRWQQQMADGVTPKKLVAFHTAHKFLVLAHHEPGYRALGRLVADAGTADLKQLGENYLALLMQSLKHHATPKKQANVLMHIMGFFKEQLDSGDKAELLGLIDAHREGLVPVIVPITLVNHFLRKFPDVYIEKQVYLEPHPRELMLRNHV